jgi:hypothetical protein
MMTVASKRIRRLKRCRPLQRNETHARTAAKPVTGSATAERYPQAHMNIGVMTRLTNKESPQQRSKTRCQGVLWFTAMSVIHLWRLTSGLTGAAPMTTDM